MSKLGRMRRIVVGLVAAATFLTGGTARAFTEQSWFDRYAENNIIFYNPNGCKEEEFRRPCVESNGYDVTVVGDSILADEATKAKIKEKLSGLEDAAYDAMASRRWDEGLKVLDKVKLNKILVFELGSNDFLVSEEQVKKLADKVGGEKTVVLVTPYISETAEDEKKEKYSKTGQVFRDFAAKNGQFKIADWAQVAKDGGAVVDEDGQKVHPVDDKTRQMYADMIVGAVKQSCGGGGARARVDGRKAKEKVWSGLLSLGYTKEQAAAVMGNMQQESGFNPAKHEDSQYDRYWNGGAFDLGKYIKKDPVYGNPYGIGLIQWSNGRRKTFYEKILEQQPLLAEQMRNPEKYSVRVSADKYIEVAGEEVANQMFSWQLSYMDDEIKGNRVYRQFFDIDKKDTRALAEFFCKKIEVPKDKDILAPQRAEFAEKIYKEFADWQPGEGSTGATTEVNGGWQGQQSSSEGKIPVNITWKDGWITGGMEGYSVRERIKDINGYPSAQEEYGTKRPKDGIVGANKILLHNMQGTNINYHYVRNDDGVYGVAPHFSIDLKQRKVQQHMSIDKASHSIKAHDHLAGVQIEIAGWSTDKDKNKKYYLLNDQEFGEAEWDYLAKLLVGISGYTGTPLVSGVNWKNAVNAQKLSREDFRKYEGVIGHMHVPDNNHSDPNDIWWRIERSLKKFSGGAMNGSNNGVAGMAGYINSLSDPCAGTSGGGAVEYWDGKDFPWYGQSNPDYRGKAPKWGSMGASACGPTSFSMAITALTGVKVFPPDVANRAGELGLHVPNAGASHSLPEKMADEYGLKAKFVYSVNSKKEREPIEKHLREGWLIWTCGKDGEPYSGDGHCILLRGITEDGKWLVADPKSRKENPKIGWENTFQKSWEPSLILSKMRNATALKAK